MNAINWHTFFFLIVAILTCGFAIAVVVSSNIVRMAFYLVACLAATAGLFFLAGATFLGGMQIMIYVGGTMVLLVFGVMLTARGPFVTMPTGGGQWIAAVIVGGSLLAVLLQTAFSVESWIDPKPDQDTTAAATTSTTALGLGLLGVRVDKPAAAESLREGMTSYLLPFEIISVHLLVVLLGAAFLARARRRRGEEPGMTKHE
jgi:NADH-quinone oxidoreductase subunit J